MPANLNQYRGTVGVFNNHNLTLKKTHGLFSCRSLQKILLKIQLIDIVIFLRVFTVRSTRTYIYINKFDIICLSETYLDSRISSDDGNLGLPGYNPTDTKRGGVCIYYHNSLPLKVIDIQFLNECINFEIRIGGNLYSFLCLYRSPSQTRDILQTFGDNFELTLDTFIDNNPFLIVAFCDFNTKTTNWYNNDIKFL